MTKTRETPVPQRLPSPLAPVSWGELIDKITILEIKSERITASESLRNIRNELAQLKAIAGDALAHDDQVRSVARELKSVNEALWETEDRIRAKERDARFDDEFIALARSVYTANDKRAALKREINVRLGSELTEEKQYTAYDRKT